MEFLSDFKVGDKVKLTEKGIDYLNEFYEGYDFIGKVGSVMETGMFIGANFIIHDDRRILFKPDELEVIKVKQYQSLGDISDISSDEEVGFPMQKVGGITDIGFPMTKVGVEMGKFEAKGKELGALVDSKQKAYGNAVDRTYDVLKVFLEPYKVQDGYKIPEELLPHILLQVRIMDKQSRIFSNPKSDLMGESPYNDIMGYSLLGSEMQDKMKDSK